MKVPTQPRVFAIVPKILPQGGTVLVLGSGPSLRRADVDYARPLVDAVICVNDTYRHLPDATCLYAADAKWWGWHDVRYAHTVGRIKYPAFTGRFKYTLSELGAARRAAAGVEVLQRGPEKGLSDDAGRVALGRNGVYQSINIAVHFGATQIVLLGVDMQGGHDFGHHPDNSAPPFSVCLERFATLVQPLKDRQIQIINCTRNTALRCFPRQPLEDVLCARQPLSHAV